jgi:hypothetical protein
MNHSNSLSRLSIVASLGMLIAFGIPMSGQEAPLQKGDSASKPAPALNEVLRHNIEDWILQGRGIPEDWSHHHLVFSNPGTEEEAIENGTHDRWLRIVNDPRYSMQQLKRGARARILEAEGVTAAVEATGAQEPTGSPNAADAEEPIRDWPPAKARKQTITKDWSMGLDGVAARQTGTVSSNGATGSSTVTVGGQTLTASAPTAASASGTFTGAPTSGQTATITNAGNGLVLTVGGTQGTGTISVSGRPGSGTGLLTVGTVSYSFETSCGSTTNCISRASGFTNSQYAGNIYAALANNSSYCTTYGSGSGCFANMTSNTGISLGSFTAGTSTSFTVTNTTGTSLPFSTTDTNVSVTGGPIPGYTGSNACTSSTAGTFVLDTNPTNLATNLAAAITACHGSYSAVGVTAPPPSTGTVTVTAATAGTGGNSIALAEGLSNFTWSGSDLSGGLDGTTSGSTFAYWSVNAAVSPTQLATNIATAVNDNTTLQASTGVTAISSGGVVTVTARATGTSGNSIGTTASLTGFAWGGSTLTGGATGTGTVQPNTFPAKYGVSLTGASCSDFVIYPTGKAGSTTAASIVADNNLYTSGCTGAVPSVYWAYNTGGTVTTSPILSEDGSQVAYIQSNGTTASLVLLKWAASTTETVGAPLTLTTQSSASAYRNCVAPCMYTLAFANTADDTFSAPFDSYGDDTIYVGDDSGNLHQFTGVFNGSPAESGSPWPVHLGANKLSSPVYDTEDGFQGGYIFVGDRGGVFYSVGSGYGGTTAGQIHGNTGSLGDVIADAPLVDSSEGTAFVFVTTNGSYSETGDNAVWEFVSSFTTLGTPGVVGVGTGGTGYYLYAGDFDNVYYESGNPAYGHLYVVGNTGTTGGGTLYQVEIAYSSLTGTVTAVATGLNSTERPWPSPLTEFCNNGTSGCAITQQRNVTGKVSTTSPEITLSSGTFTSADVGAVVTGTDIPFGDTISSVLSSTTANLSSAPTAIVSSETLAIQGGQTTSGTDYVFFSVNRSTRSGCTNGAGDGCILSYNVTNPTAVALSGSGLNVTTPGTNGCWATGGLIIDNSDTTTTGASQIYFINLNGNAAGGPTGTTQTSSGCTAGTGNTILATQASQSSP